MGRRTTLGPEQHGDQRGATMADPPGQGELITAREVILRAWRGPALPQDGAWERMAPWRPDLYAVIAVTAHSLVSAPDLVTDADITSWGG